MVGVVDVGAGVVVFTGVATVGFAVVAGVGVMVDLTGAVLVAVGDVVQPHTFNNQDKADQAFTVDPATGVVPLSPAPQPQKVPPQGVSVVLVGVTGLFIVATDHQPTTASLAVGMIGFTTVAVAIYIYLEN